MDSSDHRRPRLFSYLPATWTGSRLRTSCALLCLAAAGPLASVSFAPAAAESSQGDISANRGATRTIGLVLTDTRYALQQSADGKEECPAGLQIGEVAQFKAMPGHFEHMQKIGGTTQNRGPSGEMANYSPMTVDDPLPWNDLKTKAGYGVNLDGTQDGRKTAKTCAHEKFTSAEGQQVDNQMARVLGCVQGWRKGGFMAEFYSTEVETSPFNRVLVEITGVDDEKNDPSVEVGIYKGLDRLVRTASGSFVPFMSHRIDDRFPQYVLKMHGRIVDGVLITDPIPMARMTLIQIQIMGERRVRDMSLRLKLAPEGARGLLSGYEDLDSWWNIQSKSPGSDIGRYSPALVYKAAKRYADGYPDPVSGQCTAISVAYDVTAVRAFIMHKSKGKTPTTIASN